MKTLYYVIFCRLLGPYDVYFPSLIACSALCLFFCSEFEISHLIISTKKDSVWVHLKHTCPAHLICNYLPKGLTVGERS